MLYYFYEYRDSFYDRSSYSDFYLFCIIKLPFTLLQSKIVASVPLHWTFPSNNEGRLLVFTP